MTQGSNENWRVLLIDDDEDDFILAHHMLSQAQGRKIELEWASTYEQGQKHLQSNHYHAALVDYDLGPRTGIQLIREVTAREYAAPLILYTGRGSYEVDVEAMEAGATLYITKTEANPLLLERAIRYAIERKRAEKELQEKTQLIEKARTEAENEKRRLEAVMEALPVGVSITDSLGGIVKANKEFEQVWGSPPPETKSVRDYHAYQAWWAGSGEAVTPEQWASAQAVQKGITVKGQVFKIQRFNGSPAYVMNSASPVHDFSGKVVGSAVAIQDITKLIEIEEAYRFSEIQLKNRNEALSDANRTLQEQAEELEVQAEELRAQTEELLEMNKKLLEREANLRQISEQKAILVEAAAHLLAGADPIDRLDDFFQRFSDSLGLEVYVQYNVVKEGGDHLELGRLRGFPERYHKVLARLEFGQAVCGTVAKTRQPMYVNDVQDSKDRKTRLIKGMGIQTYACHPLIVEGRLLGTLSFGSCSRTSFDPQSIDLLHTFCNLVAHALARKQMEAEYRKTNDALRQSEAILEAFFANSPGILNIEDDEFRYIKTDPLTPTYFGLDRQSIIGKAVKDLAPEFIENFGPMMRHVIHTGQPKTREVYSPVPGRAGQITYWQATHFPVPLPGGKTGIGIMGVEITDQKKAEALLEESNNALQQKNIELEAVFQAQKDAIIVNDVDGKPFRINPAALDVLGFNPIGMPPREIAARIGLPGGTRSSVTIRALEGHTVDNVEQVIHGRTYLASAAPIQDEQNQIFGAVTVLKDINERKLTEQALHVTEERLADFLESMQDNFFALDREWRILYMNQRYADSVGVKASERIGKNFWEAFPNYTGTISEIIFRRVLSERTPAHFEASGRYTENYYEISVYPSRDGIAVFSTDRTEQHKAEQALRESEKRYRELFETMQEGLFVVDMIMDEDGKPVDWVYVDVNPEVERYMEMSYEQLVGHKYSEVVAHPDLAWINLLGRVALSGQPTSQEIYSPLRQRWLQVRVYSLHSGQAMSLFYDITERKIAEAALSEYTIRLEQSNQALQDFAFIASHDLKEPLRKVQAFGLLLEQNYSPCLDEQGQDYIQRMQSASERMQSMLDGLLEYSRVTTQGSSFGKIELQSLIKDVLTDLEVRIKETGGRVEAGELPEIEGDDVQICQLFQNLIGNALKFHRKGVPPVVKVYQGLGTRIKPESPDNYAPVIGHHSLITLFIQDNGIGFDMSQVDQLFQPFKRLVRKSDYEGSGMGLAICRKIVERHGGSISARSVPGEGSTFIVKLRRKY